MNVLLTLATAKAVSGVTGDLVLRSAKPLDPRQTVPSGKRIATEMPGIADLAPEAVEAGLEAGLQSRA